MLLCDDDEDDLDNDDDGECLREKCAGMTSREVENMTEDDKDDAATDNDTNNNQQITEK